MPIYDNFLDEHHENKENLHNLIDKIGPTRFKELLSEFDWIGGFNTSNKSRVNYTLKEGITYYLTSDLFNSYATTTKKAYRIEVSLFADYCFKQLGVDVTLDQTTNPLLLSSYLENVNKPATRNKKVGFLRSFLTELHYHFFNEEPKHFKRALKTTKDKTYTPKALTKVQLNELLDIVRQGSESYRNYVILMTYLGSGLRLSELSNLQIKDIDTNKNVLMVRSKGMKYIKQPCRITNTSLSILMTYVEFRYKCCVADESYGDLYVFSVSRGKTHIHESTIQKMFQGILAESTTIPESSKSVYSISIHSLRHSFAVMLLESGANIYAVKELLRHKNITTTEVYAKYFDDTLQNILDSKHPFACLYSHINY